MYAILTDRMSPVSAYLGNNAVSFHTHLFVSFEQPLWELLAVHEAGLVTILWVLDRDRGPSDRGPSDRGPRDRRQSDRGPSDRGQSGPCDTVGAKAT